MRSDSHTVAPGTEPITYTVDSEVVYSGDNHRASDPAEVTNQFDDVSAQFSDNADGQQDPADVARGLRRHVPQGADRRQLHAGDAIVAGFRAWDARGRGEGFHERQADDRW